MIAAMETAHVFGHHENLFGIHTDPLAISKTNKNTSHCKTAVIMLTAGMLTNVGPSRLHVSLAADLAEQGIGSFRFDLSGIGESLPVAGQGASVVRAIGEVKQAMDFLQREHDYSQFMLFGLCSGADDAIATALQDDRIVAVCSMDGCGYRTQKYSLYAAWRKYLPKVISPLKWIQLGKKWFLKEPIKGSSMPLGSDIREFPCCEQAEQEIRSLADRGVQLLFLYTGGVIDYYSYERQFYDMFPLLKGRNEIKVEYHPRWDHVAFLEEDRLQLVDRVTTWLVDGEPQSRDCQVADCQVAV